MALAHIREIGRLDLPAAAESKGKFLLLQLRQARSSKLKLVARGIGLMVGLEVQNLAGNPAPEAALTIIKRLLHRGFIFLPEGEYSNVIAFTPPLIITEPQLRRSVKALQEEVDRL
jgi:4-aminobutyrate aminotransferase-like enzyme